MAAVYATLLVRESAATKILAHVFLAACLALPPRRSGVIVFVPFRACFFFLICLAKSACCASAPHVLLMCYWLQVLRIYAARHSAFVVKLETVRHGTNEMPVQEQMSMTPFSVDTDPSIPAIIPRSIPKPAT